LVQHNAEWCLYAAQATQGVYRNQQGRAPAIFTVPAGATQVEVAIRARDNGLRPYQVRFNPMEGVWLLKVLNWRYAA
jgi:hypothetical protein